ncbi:MAG: hypothetical protein WCI71_14955, partial [Bacteroidota bacterium]
MYKKLFYQLRVFMFTALIFSFTGPVFSQVLHTAGSDQNQYTKRIPFERYLPMPMPEITAPLNPNTDAGQLVRYDMKTRKQVIGEKNPQLLSKIANFINGGQPSDSSKTIPQPEMVNGNFTALSYISTPAAYPWQMNCKLFMTFTDGGGGLHYYVASGSLIDDKHVLTAGHVVWDNASGLGWATEIIVVPGFENGNQPYGNSYSGALWSWTGWVNSGDYNHDMGIVELTRPVGCITGFFGYGYSNDDNFFATTTFNNASYPAESPYDGNYMYYQYGTYDEVYANLCYFHSFGYKGQSGGGSYAILSGNRYMYAEQSHRQWMGSYWRAGQVRITGSKFTDIGNIISGDTPASVDLVALDANFEPATLSTGDQVTAFNFLVYNNSSVTWSGYVYYDAYLSTDNIITTSDTWLDNQYFYWTFPPKSTVRVNGLLFNVPWSVPVGDYYMGVVLNFADNNTGNNSTNGWDAVPVHINEGSLPAPSPFTATKADYYSFIYTYWPAVAGATNYMVFRNTVYDPNTATAISGWQSSTWLYDFTASSGTIYYYWVKSAADAYGYASSSFSLGDYGYKNGDLNCGAPVNLYCGSPYSGSNGSGSYNIAMYPSCSLWDESGPEVIHKIDVYNTGTLTATLSGLSTDLDVFILSNCDKTNCLAVGD